MAYTVIASPTAATPAQPTGKFRVIAPPPAAVPVPAGGGRDIAQQPMGGYTGSTAGDVAKSAGVGVGEGTISLAGGLGDTREMAGSAGSWLASKFGISPEAGQQAAQMVAGALVPGSSFAPSTAQLTKGVKSVTGEFYQPKTAYGKAAETVGSYAPAAVAGPGGVIRKVAMTAIPGGMAAGAEYLSGGNEAAKTAAGLLGTALSAGRSPKGFQLAAKEAPVTGQPGVQKAAKTAFDTLRNMGVRYDPQGYGNMVARAAHDLTGAGYDRGLAPGTAVVLKNIKDKLGQPLDYNQVEALREQAGSITRDYTASGKDKTSAGILLNHLNDYVVNGISDQNLAPQVADLLKTGKDLARRNILAKQIRDMEGASIGYEAGQEAGRRAQFRNYYRNAGKRNLLTPTEKEAYANVFSGGRALQVPGKIGFDLSPHGGRAALLPIATSVFQPHLWPAVIAGTAAKYGAHLATGRRVGIAEKTVLAGREAQKTAEQTAAKLRSERLARRLLGFRAATGNGGGGY